ncbi:MAG TPA: family 43 glycosylhydrolase [Draconibacterium sp.]|nr:family 43 glycosylhydrolase [Draconibacterium sp.]
MQKIILILVIFTLCFSFLNHAQEREDSVIVVKGQVSDYTITVRNKKFREGQITGPDGKPLEGATVMFQYSPVHHNTDEKGIYKIIDGGYDTVLVVFYPGMEMATVNVKNLGRTVNVKLNSGKHTSVKTEKAKATEWFDPMNDHPKTFCNPVNISYNFEPYNNNVKPNGSFRSSADPMLVNYKGEYFLFSTNQGGFHYSKDLSHWEFVYASFQRMPTDDDQCAPAAFVSGDTLFYTGSTYRGLPVWYSTDPKSGRFKRKIESVSLPFWDPAFFLDDDKRLYIYYGSSNEFPLKAVELDRTVFYPNSKITDVMMLQPELHGWERFGMNNDDSTTLAPFTEGAFVNKHKGKYYFQYGAPGTEFKVYADGVYVADKPLGPFTYQKHNPVSYKPGGFVQGAGHGGTFQDNYGNYWHIATCMLSLKYKFERRIGLYPAGFDEVGTMYVSTGYGDYPCLSPFGKTDHRNGTFAGWMLLSYQKPVTVSSIDDGSSAQNASDENMRTYWAAASGEPGEWLQIDLGDVKELHALQINYYEHNAFQHNKAMDLYHQYRIYHSTDGKNWTLLVDKSDNDLDIPHDYVELKKPVNTRYLKIENLHVPTGTFAISDFRVFGVAKGVLPEAVRNFKVERSAADSRNAQITWSPVKGAYGYNIWYGVETGKLYNCITVNGETEYNFRGMDKETTYWFSVEALGETGKSKRGEEVEVK